MANLKNILLSSLLLASISHPQSSRYWQAPLKRNHFDSNAGETAYHRCTLSARNGGAASLHCLPLFVKGKDTTYSSSDGFRYIEEGKWEQKHDTLIFKVKRKTAGPGGSVSVDEERKYRVKGEFIEDILPPYQRISEKEFNRWIGKWGNGNHGK